MAAPGEKEEQSHIFMSTRHPGRVRAPNLLAQLLLRKLAVAMLPLMIVTLTGVLHTHDIRAYLVFGLPAAVVVAVAWTAFEMRLLIVEVRIRHGYAAICTLWHCMSARQDDPWLPVFDVRRSRASIIVGLGDAVYEFRDTDWPQYEAMLEAFVQSKEWPSSAGIPPS